MAEPQGGTPVPLEGVDISTLRAMSLRQPELDTFGAMQSAARQALDWRDYVGILKRRRWPAFAVFATAVTFSLVHAFTRVPVYQAQARLLIEPDRANVTGLMEPLEKERSSEADLQTQLALLQSRSLARRAMQTVGAQDAPASPPTPAGQTTIPTSAEPGSFKAFIRSVREAISRVRTDVAGMIGGSHEPVAPMESTEESARINAFLGGLRVSPLAGGRLIDVFYQSTDPVAAATSANAVVSQFIQQSVELNASASRDVSEWLNERLTEQRQALDASEQTLQAYRERHALVSLTEQASLTVQKLTDLTTAFTRAKTERIEKEALVNQLSAVQHDRASLDAFPAVLDNAVVQQLKAELVTLQREQAQLAAKFGVRHPSLIKIREAVGAAEGRLRSEIGQTVEAVRREYLAARAAETSLSQAVEAQKREALSLNRKDIELAVLHRDAESNRRIYDSLLQRANEFGVARERRANNIRIVDSAEVPQTPLGTGMRRDLRYGVLGGLLLGLCVAFVLEHLDGHIKTPRQIKSDLALPFLGLLPHVKTATGASPRVDSVPSPAFAEALRILRTNVRLSIATEGPRVIVVTSACSGEGKTVVASNLALALALTDQRVILIDADFRRPRLHKVFNVRLVPGLSNLLVGETPASQAVRQTGLSRLHLLTCGMPPPNPAELLDSGRFNDLLQHLRDHYDWVIIDSPPVLPVTDAIVLATRASGVVLVAAADTTPLPAARAAVEQLAGAHARLLGAVLNGVDLERHAYYYARYHGQDYNGYYTVSRDRSASSARTA
jgi:polysaccharide biosynthesis transport protein